MNNKKHYPAMVLTALLLLFVIQNVSTVQVNILFWSFHAPRSLVLIFVFFIGVTSGYIFARKPKENTDDQ